MTNRQHCGATTGCGIGGGSDAGTDAGTGAGAACADGQVCSGGTCKASCQSGLVNCNGSCIDPQTSRQYCGATNGCGNDAGTAGTSCATNYACYNGTCERSFPTVTFSQAFTAGTTPTAQCTAWQTFASQIDPGVVYSSITIKGSNDATGRTCTGAFANTLCQGIRTNTTVAVTTCDGHSWSYGVGGCLPYRELDADLACNCGSQYDVRACIGNGTQWGGITNSSCNDASQTITVLCTP
jgi:hypothetical protein